MTKKEAIKSMLEGHKVAHAYFSKDEWISIDEDRYIVTEDGYHIDPYEFWKYRTGEAWEDNWSIKD